MANIFTNLAADIFTARDTVGRSLSGLINAVTVNADGTTRVAKGDNIRAAFTRPQTVNTTYAPSMTIPEGTDQTVDSKTMPLNSWASIQIPYTGEDQKHLNNGPGYTTVYGDQIQQAMESIVSQIDSDLALSANNLAGNAYGTAGTTPFATTMNDFSNIRKVLTDRKCPITGGQISAVYNTTTGVNIRNLPNLYKVNEAGDSSLLRAGSIGNLQGMNIREDQNMVLSHTAGTGASYVLNGIHAKGATSIVAKTGTGTLLPGDVVTINSRKYVVNTGLASAGTFTINSGLLAAGADGDTITLGASYASNIVCHRNAIELGMRPIALPDGGDAARSRLTVQDPFSGMIFEFAHYVGYQKSMIEVGVLYGYQVWKPDFVAIHLG